MKIKFRKKLSNFFIKWGRVLWFNQLYFSPEIYLFLSNYFRIIIILLFLLLFIIEKLKKKRKNSGLCLIRFTVPFDLHWFLQRHRHSWYARVETRDCCRTWRFNRPYIRSSHVGIVRGFIYYYYFQFHHYLEIPCGHDLDNLSSCSR